MIIDKFRLMLVRNAESTEKIYTSNYGSICVDIPERTFRAPERMTGQDFYATTKTAWSRNPELLELPFPLTPITSESFEYYEDEWTLLDVKNLMSCGIRAVPGFHGRRR